VVNDNSKQMLMAGGVAILVTLLFRRATHSPEDDTDALTRMLITETDFARNTTEMAQIVYVAINRARKWGVDITDVVNPSGSGVPVAWNRGSAYRTRFDNAKNNPRWAAARVFVQKVQAGSYANYGATSFVHPSGMPKPPCSSGVATSTFAGDRCIPTWAVNGRVVGGAMFA